MPRGRRRRRFGIAEYSLALLFALVGIPVLIYYVTGMGIPPTVRMTAEAKGDSVVLVVEEGKVAANDWEYILFDERLNPPVEWIQGPGDIEAGAEIILGSGLKPSKYRLKIRHVPTARLILDTKVDVT
ncbi:TPA: hypothetical protein EYP44_01165 [Candidatus Bathyarchaeota archaeon]|nr:hypothetical protein [Candidatus Bathyarchaeota archaeon]